MVKSSGRLGSTWRRNLLSTLLAFVSVIFPVSESRAQEGPDGRGFDLSRPLTLEDCINIGLMRATRVRTAELGLQLDELRVRDASAAYLPTVQTQGRYSFNDRVDFGFKRENYDLNLSSDYLLWDQGRRGIALNQARTNRDASAARLQRNRQELVFDIVRAYYDLLAGKQLVALDAELLGSSQNNAARIRAFYEAEKLIEADVAAAEVRVATDELNLVNDQNTFEIAQANLPTVLGLDPGTALSVADDPGFQDYLATGRIERDAKTPEEAIELALKQRPEVQESELSLRVLELEQKRAQLDRWPRLTAESNFTANVDDYLHEGGDFKNFRTWSVAAVLSFPLFDGGLRQRAVERADVELQRVREQNAELRRRVALEVRQAYLNLMEAEKRLEISAVQVRNARLSLEVTQGRFDQDLAIPLELFEAQAQYARATTNQIRAYYDYKTAQQALELAIGKPYE